MNKPEPILTSDDPRFKTFLMRFLRKASYMWPARNEALRDAKVSWGRYKCAECHEIYQKKDIDIDHVNPVIDVKGFDSWDNVIARLFCEREGFQILCKPCHKIKTKDETDLRVEYRKGK